MGEGGWICVVGEGGRGCGKGIKRKKKKWGYVYGGKKGGVENKGKK